MSSYRLTARAEGDVLDIFLYGIERFGLSQARAYKTGMEHCLQMLADNPRIGRLAPALGQEVRRHEFGRHVVLYDVDGEGTRILAVVHGRSIRRLEL